MKPRRPVSNGAWLAALVVTCACIGPWNRIAAQALPAGMEALGSTRGMIGMMRDMLANQARQMAATGQPMDIERMFDQVEAGSGTAGRRKAEPVDPTLQALSCPALAARVTRVDAAIEARFVEDEQRQTAIDARIAADNAANAATQRARSLACNANPLTCLPGALMGRSTDAAMSVRAQANGAEVRSIAEMRAGFDPLLRERSVAIYHQARKACK